MLNKLKTKSFYLLLVVAMALLGSICFATLNWSYLVECSNSLTETTVGILRKPALDCYASCMVEPYDADTSIRVFLQTIDEDGDWVNVTAWYDGIDDSIAAIEEIHQVGPGTYRLYIANNAYAEDEHEAPVEIHYSYSREVVIPD